MKTLRILIILFLSESECSMYVFTNIFSGYRPTSVLAIAVLTRVVFVCLMSLYKMLSSNQIGKLISEKESIPFSCFLSLGSGEQILNSEREPHAVATAHVKHVT